MTTELKVPKDKEGVIIHLGNGITLEGVIFLEQSPFEMPAHQRVCAMMEDENSFFPLLLNNTGNVEFINKKSVMILETTFSADSEDEALSLSLMHIENVTAMFNDGSTVNGAFMAEVPEDKARLSDCLNLPGNFLSLRVNGKLLYINKNWLQRVVYAKKP